MADSRRNRHNRSRAWLILAALLGILILGDLNSRMVDARRLERDAANLATEVIELEQRNASLQTQVAGATSDAAVEAWARSEARMVGEGERLIIPVPADPNAAARTPEPETGPAPPSNLDIWLALLFGD